MSSPTAPDLSASSPSALLGDPSAAVPPLPSIGGRGRGARRSLGPLGGDWSRKGPRAPLSPQQREEGRQRLQVVRPQPAPPQPAPATPLRERERTAAGAPVEQPRRIPKTGAAEQTRDAHIGSMNKEAGQRYNAKPAAIQAIINDIRRAHYDNMDREQLADEADFWVGKKERTLDRDRPPGVVEAVRRAKAALRGEGAASPIAGPLAQMADEDTMAAHARQRRAAKQQPLRRTDLEPDPLGGELPHERDERIRRNHE